jgi:flagellar basal-body rod modification protein FlgD
MATTNPLTSALGAATTTSSSSSAKTSGSALGKDDFLKLMVAQMQNQNPLDPTDDKEFLAQMASFSTLEQITNMATANQALASSLVDGQAVNLVGKTVSYENSDGSSVSGSVESVTLKDGTPTLTVDGVSGVAISQVTEVR